MTLERLHKRNQNFEMFARIVGIDKLKQSLYKFSTNFIQILKLLRVFDSPPMSLLRIVIFISNLKYFMKIPFYTRLSILISIRLLQCVTKLFYTRNSVGFFKLFCFLLLCVIFLPGWSLHVVLPVRSFFKGLFYTWRDTAWSLNTFLLHNEN